MLKLMFVHHSGAPGGAGISLANNLKLLSEDNNVIAYIPSSPEFISGFIQENCPNVDVKEYGKRIGAVTYYSGGDSIFSTRFFYRLFLIIKQFVYWNSEIKKNAPDIVIANSMILCWMSLLPQMRKRKSILFVRETMRGSRYNWVNRIICSLLNKFDRVIFLSNYDRDCINLHSAKGEVIHNSINSAQLRKVESLNTVSETLGLSKDCFCVLYVGGVNEMKGFDLAVRAVLSAGSKFHLIAVGNNFDDAMETKSLTAKAYIKKWKSYIETNDKIGQIHILGRQKDMTFAYATCDVLLFPMRSPHQARPVFEAGYYKKPVIISKFDNINEFVTDGENGFIVHTDDVEAIIEKLHLLRDNPVLATAMGERNYSITIEKHNADNNYKKLCEIIRETIDK